MYLQRSFAERHPPACADLPFVTTPSRLKACSNLCCSRTGKKCTVELLLSIALLRPRQPCHGAQGMDFDGRSLRVGPDCARVESGSAQNGSPGRWRSSHVRPGVPTTRAPDFDAVQEAANQRVIKLEAALRAMGDYDGPEVATLKSCVQMARAVSHRFRIKLRKPRHSFFVPRKVCQFWKRNTCASKSCWTKRCFAKNGCGAI